jgi:hypothetical protein
MRHDGRVDVGHADVFSAEFFDILFDISHRLLHIRDRDVYAEYITGWKPGVITDAAASMILTSVTNVVVHVIVVLILCHIFSRCRFTHPPEFAADSSAIAHFCVDLTPDQLPDPSAAPGLLYIIFPVKIHPPDLIPLPGPGIERRECIGRQIKRLCKRRRLLSCL